MLTAYRVRTNVLTVVSLVATINGLLTWIGKGFGLHQLTLQLILRYVFYPVTFFTGKFSSGLPNARYLVCIPRRCAPE